MTSSSILAKCVHDIIFLSLEHFYKYFSTQTNTLVVHKVPVIPVSKIQKLQVFSGLFEIKLTRTDFPSRISGTKNKSSDSRSRNRERENQKT